MFRLRRFYLDSIGVADNRFSDLMVDLTDRMGEPADAIVWLRNGAGKTTMLSLLLALILPDRRDFLATRTKKRTLEDLILSRDTAHVVAEWVDPAGQVLLTGAVYEWEGGVRPKDYRGAGKDRLRRSWWCVSPDPAIEGSTLDDLPFTLRSKGNYDRDRFRSHIRALAAQGVNAVVADHTIDEWHRALRERRFDPELFHYFTEVNAAEGGIDGLFAKIDSPGAFVRYLLRFVGDRQRISPVRELLAETAVEIAKRPTYLAEREFCTEAQPRVSAVGEAHAKFVAAAQVRQDRRESVASFKRALLDAAAAAETRRSIAAQRLETVEAEYKDLRNSGDNARRRRDEYLRIAASFRVADARAQLSDANTQVTHLEVEASAWAAVPDFVALTTARALLEIRTQAFAEAEADARPLMAALDRGRAVLAGALDAALGKTISALTSKRAELAEQKRVRVNADKIRLARHGEKVRLEAEHEVLTGTVERFATARSGAVEDGILAEHERVHEAVTRLKTGVTATTKKIERLTGEQKSVRGAMAGAETKYAQARTAHSQAVNRYRRVEDELRRLLTRASEIADSPRLRALAQSDTVDLAVQWTDAIGLLRQAVAATEAAMVDTRAAKADDERAVLGLESHGLLPARSEVAKVVDELNSVGVTAHSGWRYLAKNVPAMDHAERITELPEVLDGVVVYGDPVEAAARIDVEFDEVVVLSSAAAFRGRRDARVVLGPSAARYDSAAAKSELARRRTRLAEQTDRLTALDRQRRTDTQIASQIEAWQAEIPDDGIDGLRRRVDTAAGAVQKAEEAEHEAEVHLAALRDRNDVLVGLVSEEQNALVRGMADLKRLMALETEEREHVEPATARLTAIPALLDAVAEEEEKAARRFDDANERIQRLGGEIHGLESSERDWTTRRSSISVTPTPTTLTIDAAEAAVREAEAHLRERFQEDDLRRAVSDAERTVGEAADRWGGHDGLTRARAEELAVTSAGTDRALRAEETAKAKADLGAAHRAVGAATGELEAAETELRKASPRGRLRHTEQVEDVADRAGAQRLAAAANAEATEIQLRVGSLERRREAFEDEIERARTRAGMLRDQAGMLRGVEAAEVAAGTVPEEDGAVRTLVQDLAARLDAVEAAYTSAASTRSQKADQLRSWASADRFAVVAEDEHGQAVRRLRELFSGEQVTERVAERAGELTDDLVLRGRAIGQQLEQVEEHKNNVVQRLAELVEDALSVLGRASTLSELPEGIGPWEHQRFLLVEAKQRPSREQVTLRVGELVDRMVSAGKIELDAIELLWRATEAAVVEGFRASVLKPAPDQPTGRTPVEDMRKWSGGENLTASLVLFCVMARLRAEQRTGTKAGNAGGVVPLDNPLGKANYLPFLELQRRVADASGVQLVFWTGIGDLGAVTAFPRIAAMHKRPSATRPGRAYVQSDPDSSFTGEQMVDVVTSVRDEP